MTDPAAGARFGDVFRVRTFRVFYGAELQSIVGDQLARVALSVLVFDRTGSASVTTLVYALTFLPAIVGGVALARVGDRWARPTVMIGCDVLRAAAFASMALPGLPLVAVGALLVAAVFVAPTFSAASASLLAARLSPSQFRTASGVRMSTNQLAQVMGFAVAGVLVAAVGAREALVVNAATYLVSAGVVMRWLREDPVPQADRTATDDDQRATVAEHTVAEHTVAEHTVAERRTQVLRTVLRDPRARTMLALSLLAGLFVVPESVAIPFAAQVHASTTQAGLLLATIPLGSAVGVLVLVRCVAASGRFPIALGMAVFTGVPLIVTGFVTDLPVAAVCWFLSGVAAAYQVESFVTLVGAVPDRQRARLISLVTSLLLGAQGLGPIAFGALASASTPSLAVAVAGTVGVVGAGVAVLTGVTTRVRDTAGAHRATG